MTPSSPFFWKRAWVIAGFASTAAAIVLAIAPVAVPAAQQKPPDPQAEKAAPKTDAPWVGGVRPSADCPMEVCIDVPTIGWSIPMPVDGKRRTQGEDNPFQAVLSNPLATISMDVDRGAYANVRRFLNQNQLPPKDAVRIEGLINYFNYDYAAPAVSQLIVVYTEMATAPWSPTHQLVRIGIKTRAAVARDVKIQVDFKPAKVEAYRLIGYENPDLEAGPKDAVGREAGRTVTVLFEIIQSPTSAVSNEVLTVHVRYKLKDAAESTQLNVPVARPHLVFGSASRDFRFAAAVAEFGMILRNSPYKGQASLDQSIAIAEQSQGVDKNGNRAEFVRLARRARVIQNRQQ